MQLIHVLAHTVPKYELAWEGTASEQLGFVLSYLQKAEEQRRLDILAGKHPNCPQAVFDAALKADHENARVRFTVTTNEDGSFDIFPDDGPDYYTVID